jgi:predicted amidohydrolase
MTAAPRSDGKLNVALISEVFWEADGAVRLRERLADAVGRGADVAVLPELPLNPWRPATKDAVEADAEPMGGARMQAQASAAAEAGIGLVGGIIHRDLDTGRRTSRAIVFDRSGELVATYEKLHLPEEPGFWETSHYEPAAGAMAVLAPRATEERTYQRWKVVFRANALTSCCYILSVNRPHPEEGVLIGGPSIAVDPNGEVLLETTEPIGIVTLDAATVTQARVRYPGYLPVRARLYADAWSAIAGSDGEPA